MKMVISNKKKMRKAKVKNNKRIYDKLSLLNLFNQTKTPPINV